MAAFLRNRWYIAAWSHELGASLLPRTLLGRPLVLFRGPDGAPAALADLCPHRFAPLSRGRLDGEEVVCGYHGLRFDRHGRCIGNPHGGRTPSSAAVRAWPILDRHGAAWIWPGDPDRADPALIPDFGFLDEHVSRRAIHGHTRLGASHRIVIDNLMDLSHVEYLHGGSFASGVLHGAEQRIVQEADRVTSTWWSPGVDNPPVMEPAFAAGGRKVDHWLEMRWDAPATMRLETGVTLAGRPRGEGATNLQAHVLTPETERTSHYFWAMSRTERLDDRDYQEMIRRILSTAFDIEDKPMLEAIQASMETAGEAAGAPVLLAIDAAAVRAQRVLTELLEAERAGAAPTAAQAALRG